MAEKLPNVLSDNELRDLRHEDDTMERTGVVRSGSRMGWEATKGALTGGAISSLIGVPLTIVAPPLGIGLIAAGIASGAGINTLWGSVAKGSAVREDEEALQKAALMGAQQNGQLTPEQAQGLAPKRSLLKGLVTSLGVGGGMGVAIGAIAIGTAAAPLVAAAAVGAVAITAFNAYRNHKSNEAMQTTVEKAASMGGMKARKAALEANVQQHAVAPEKSQEKFKDLGVASAAQSGAVSQETSQNKLKDLGGLQALSTPAVAKTANPQDKSKKTRA